MSYFLFVLEINRQVNSSTLAATTWNSSSVFGNAFSSTRISCLRVFKHAMIISMRPYSWHGINCGRTARKFTAEMTAQRESSLSPSFPTRKWRLRTELTKCPTFSTIERSPASKVPVDNPYFFKQCIQDSLKYQICF